jgi:Ca2+-binding EF-hand superfamily protein
LEEFLGERTGDDWKRGRVNFFTFDAECDSSLTLQEFAARGKGVVPSARQLFLGRDFDDNGRLSLEEFLFGQDAPQARAASTARLRLFDYDADGSLSFEEFQLLPMAQPDRETRFRGRDKNQDGRLSPQELALFHSSAREAAWVQASLPQFDADGDGSLSLEEFETRATELQSPAKTPDAPVAAARSRVGPTAIGLAGVIYAALLYAAFRFGRSRRATEPPAPRRLDASTPPPSPRADVAAATPVPTAAHPQLLNQHTPPQSIEDFRVE